MRRFSNAAALAIATALLASGCGGEDSSTDSDDIKGAGKPSESPSSSSPIPDPDDDERPDISLPKDLKLAFEWDEPAQKDEAAALDGAKNFIQAIAHGINEQDSENAGYKYYSAPLKQAQGYAKDQIEQYIEGGWTLAGTDRFSKPVVKFQKKGERASVTLCNNQSDLYGKEVDSGEKVEGSEDKPYSVYWISMVSVPEVDGLWHAVGIDVKGGKTPC